MTISRKRHVAGRTFQAQPKALAWNAASVAVGRNGRHEKARHNGFPVSGIRLLVSELLRVAASSNTLYRDFQNSQAAVFWFWFSRSHPVNCAAQLARNFSEFLNRARYLSGRIRSRHHQRCDVGRARLPEHIGGGVQRGTAGHDIVD